MVGPDRTESLGPILLSSRPRPSTPIDTSPTWSMNIVRLPLKPEAGDDLGWQMRSFPPEFLLFVKHVCQLTLNGDQSEIDRTLELADVDGEYLLRDGDATSEWKLFNNTHRLSDNARADRRSLDNDDEALIWWAVPLDRLTDSDQFWAFFPTKTESLVAGILNAPWKTNEDRQNLLPGPYNDELLESAAKMVADNLPDLSTQTDPARHLDALPRRHERGDTEQADRLRNDLFHNLHDGREIIPDQDGNLRAAREISYPPKKLTPDGKMDMAPFNRWAAYAGRPSDWLHHRALTRNRLAVVDRLWPDQLSPAPRAAVAEWLEALVTDQEPENITEASMAAIQTAAHISPEIRLNESLGDIVLMANGELKAPDPERIFLPLDGGHGSGPDSSVHPELASDGGTLAALKKLGIKPPSPENTFKRIAEKVLNSPAEPNATLLTQFWEQARKVESAAARYIIQGIKNHHRDHHRAIWPEKLLVRTQSGDWRPLHSVLLPGGIVPGDGSRDDHATVDMSFHQPDDLELLNNLGVTDAPRDDRDLSLEPQFRLFLTSRRQTFRDLPDLPHTPERDLLNFISTRGVGPMEVLTVLSDEGRVLYTDALLSHDATYEQWTMRHDTVHYYPEKPFESLTIHMLREHGRVRTSDGIVVPFEDALGEPQPENPAALRALLAHPKADRIKEAFNLSEPTPEFIGEEDQIPLTDVWPGLDKHLPARRKTCQLIRCERILSGIGESECVFHDGDVYLARTGDDDEDHELWLVSRELELDLNERQLEAVLQYETLREIEERRTAVREHTTDTERLLEAVGEQVLRRGLPSSLLAILEFETKGAALTDLQIAEATIATYHSDALKQYKRELGHLGPPKKWAGSAPAVAFVRSLGFSAEWAGEQKRRRDPFVEIEGPYLLPELHGYQRTVVDKARDMLRDRRVDGAERRGMISMPTGSGKTRVAVQAIVEAMCHDSFKGGVLWVADRDELCEQAVEAWQQVWSSIGAHGSRLRVSRMWAGQPEPLQTSDFHVVVATIQTLNAKLKNQPSKYEFLTDFKLVAFDEAHRSIAPTFTSVMQEIGLTRRQEADEPFLLGLTATPYRGYNEEETAWLVNLTAAAGSTPGRLRATIRRELSANCKVCACSREPTTKPSKGACFR